MTAPDEVGAREAAYMVRTEPAFQGDIEPFNTLATDFGVADVDGTFHAGGMVALSVSFDGDQHSKNTDFIVDTGAKVGESCHEFVAGYSDIKGKLVLAYEALETLQANSDTNWSEMLDLASAMATADGGEAGWEDESTLPDSTGTFQDDFDRLDGQWTTIRDGEDDIYRGLIPEFDELDPGAEPGVDHDEINRLLELGIEALKQSDDPDAERWLRLAQTEQDKLSIIRAGGEDMAEDLIQYDELRELGVDPDVAIKLVGTPDDVVDGVLDGKLNADDALKVAELKWSERHHILNSDLDADTISEILGGDYGDSALEALLAGDDDRVDRLLLDPETRAATDVNVAMPTLLGDDDDISFEEIVERTENRKDELIQLYIDQGMSPEQAEAAYGDLQDSVDFYVENKEARDRLDGAADDDSREGNPDADNKFSVEDAQIRALETLEASDAPSAQGFRLEIYEQKITAGESVRVGSVPTADQEAVADLIIDHNVEVVETSDQLSPEFEQAMQRLNELGLDAQGLPIRGHVANEFLEIGLETKAKVGDSGADEDFNSQQLSILMTNSGLQLMTESEQAAHVEALAEQEFTLPDGTEVSGTELMVMALDLDERHSNMGHGLGAYWQDDNMWAWRIQTTDELLNSVLNPDGTVKPGGYELAEAVFDVLPEHALDVTSEELEGFGPPDGVPEFNFKVTLATVLAAPNYGVSDEAYDAAVQLEELNKQLQDPALSNQEFEQLLGEFNEVAASLGDEDTQEFVLKAMSEGIPADEALRIAISASDPTATDKRVERLRLLFPVDPMGNPDVEKALELGMPEGVAESLSAELAVLQNVQVSRYVERLEQPDEVLSPDQLLLIGDLQTHIDEIHDLNIVANHYLSEYQLLEMIANDGKLSINGVEFELYPGTEISPELQALAEELTKEENEAIWQYLPGAADNETFMGPDGFRPPGRSTDLTDPNELAGPRQISDEDFIALQVQLTLLNQVGPRFSELDANEDGKIHEDERDAWLEKYGDDIPPVIADRVRFGADLGFGEDTFGWDEIGETIGWIGLAAAVTTSVVYTGGAAAPLWVKAGLVALAVAETGAFIAADDPFNAVLAAGGGAFDIFEAVRLFRVGKGVTQVDQIRAGLKIGDDILQNPGRYTDEEIARFSDELAVSATKSEIPALRALGERADQLSPEEFLAEYRKTLGENRTAYIAQMRAEGKSPAEINSALRDLPETLSPGSKVMASEGHRAGLPKNSETVRTGEVRMEDHPDFDATVAELREKGYVVRDSDQPHPYVETIQTTHSDGSVTVEVQINLVPGMRYIDFEHELIHVQNYENHGLVTRRLEVKPAGNSEVSDSVPGNILTGKKANIEEYYTRLVEYKRLHERGLSQDVLEQHASGVREYRERSRRFLRSSKGQEYTNNYEDFDELVEWFEGNSL